MTEVADRNEMASTTGSVLHAASAYDLLIWLVTFGRERAYRDRMLRLANLKPGESVLDVGCGTGSLAIAAKQQVGPAGTVCGVDPSPEMIARAEKKARKAGSPVVFKKAFAQSLSFPDAQFDVVLSTVMLHHLPPEARHELAVETYRVLKPGGRVLVIEFGWTRPKKKSFFGFFHHHHGLVESKEVVTVLNEAGLKVVESGAVGVRDLYFVLATAVGRV
jgi:ubiquinone/menaquinone biosynthesis C-methylase UbiE